MLYSIVIDFVFIKKYIASEYNLRRVKKMYFFEIISTILVTASLKGNAESLVQNVNKTKAAGFLST